MNIIFFGNTQYSRIVAQKLHEVFKLTAIVTIPDRPMGRKKILTPSPVKQFATEHNIPVITGERFSSSERSESRSDAGQASMTSSRQARTEIYIEDIAKFNPDFLVVADYGLFLPGELLKVPTFAPLNVHHSLLPKHRGPSPAPTAILNGEKVSGVTIIKMVEQIDAGDMLAQEEYELKENETTDSLLTKLNQLGADLVVQVINNFERITPKKQTVSKANVTSHIKKSDGYIDLKNPPSAEKLDRMIRAFYPWPNVWTKVAVNNKDMLLKFLPDKKLQVGGGKPMSVKDFLNGYPQLKSYIVKLYGSNG